MALLSLGCTKVVVHEDATTVHHHGPPPHAPAHGYRYKAAKGVECTYDSHLGVYVVVGHHDHYYDGERYYRRARGGWETAIAIEGSWRACDERALPRGLRSDRKGKKK